jgi:outer membrane receptor protein involved in Fe transport
MSFRNRARVASLGVALCLALISQAQAGESSDEKELLNLSLDQLMQADVLEGAAKYPISLEDAPAVMDVITAEEIREIAPRDLTDLLAQLPSLVVENDRVQPRVTVRGTAIPGDATTRILVLVDGHVLHEHWNGTSPLYALIGVAPSQIKRLEVVRGPGSVLFGSSALWATVNIVTRDGSEIGGAQWQGAVEPEGDAMRWAMSLGKRRKDSDLAVHVQQIQSAGDRMNFRDREGIYRGASDAEAALTGRIRWQWRDLVTVTLASADRTDHVPHEWYQSLRGRDENRYRETASQAELALTVHPRPNDRLELRFMTDAYRGRWYTVYADSLSRQGWGVWVDDGTDRNVAGELTYVAVQGDRVRGAFGLRARQVEVLQHSGQRTIDENDWTGEGDVVPLDARTHRFTVLNAYATAQLRFSNRVQGFGGALLNRTLGVQRLTPKAGILVDAGRGMRLRAMAGDGFRTPSVYERTYTDGMSYVANPDLRAETVRTYEVALTQTLGARARGDGRVLPTFTLTGYHNDLESLVSLAEIPKAETIYARSADYADTLYQYVNLGAVRTRGLELSAQHLRWGRWRGSAHVAWQHAHDEHANDLPNSPGWTGGARVSRTWGVWLAGLEGRYLGPRLSYAGHALNGFATFHLQLGWQRPDGGAEARLRVDNLFDARGEVALYQPDFSPLETIPTEGRRVSAQVTARF